MLGTDFPYRNFYPTNAKIVQIDRDPAALGRRAQLTLALVGDVGETLRALLPAIKPTNGDDVLPAKKDAASDKSIKKSRGDFLRAAQVHYQKARKRLDDLACPRKPGEPLHPQYIANMVDKLAAEDAVFTADVGTLIVWAACYLHMNGKRRLLGSFNHGSMANAMPQALGAQAASPGRQVVSLSGDGGFTMLMGDMLTAVQLKLPVKIVLFNNGSLGFVEMEMKASGYLDAHVALQNPDFAAIAQIAGFKGLRVTSSEALEPALREAFVHLGPALVDVSTARQELIMPPKMQAAQAKGFSLYALKAVISGRGDEVIELARTNLFR